MRRFDPGWPWLLAGLMMLVAAAVIPSQLHLESEHIAVQQLRIVRDQEQRIVATYERFLDEVGRGQDTVIRRLAAAQLGLIPVNRSPYVPTSGLMDPPTRWIERAAYTATSDEEVDVPQPTASMLADLSQGSGRLWLFGGALLSIFVGLLLAPSTDFSRRN